MEGALLSKVMELAERAKELENATLMNSQGLNGRLQAVERGLQEIRAERSGEAAAAATKAREDEIQALKDEIAVLTRELAVFKAKAEKRLVDLVAAEIAKAPA